MGSVLVQCKSCDAEMKTRSTFRRCAFRPGGRFRNHLILAIRNAVGQLALGEDVARNVLVVGGIVAQPGDSVVGIENNDRLAEILAFSWP